MSARIVVKKDEHPITPKENRERLKAQPLIEAKVEEIKAAHAAIDSQLAAQLDAICKRFEGRNNYNAKCWSCHTITTLQVDRTEVIPFATGECWSCGTRITHYSRMDFNPQWPNQIRDALFPKDKVGVRHLIDFMQEIGLSDLTLKYRNVPVVNHYHGRDIAKRNADRDEALLFEMLKPHYDPQHHLHIAYMEEGKTAETHRFPDIIIGCDNWVFVLEVKMSYTDLKEDQVEAYHHALKSIVGNSKRQRSVATVLVTGHEKQAVKGKHTTLSDLLHIREKQDIEAHLLSHATYVSEWRDGAYIDVQP